jgi:hypothetical protein
MTKMVTGNSQHTIEALTYAGKQCLRGPNQSVNFNSHFDHLVRLLFRTMNFWNEMEESNTPIEIVNKILIIMRTTHVTFTHGYVMYTAELNGHLHGNMKE